MFLAHHTTPLNRTSSLLCAARQQSIQQHCRGPIQAKCGGAERLGHSGLWTEQKAVCCSSSQAEHKTQIRGVLLGAAPREAALKNQWANPWWVAVMTSG